ncbi:MAG: S-layer protein domain-containing protein, partial [Methanothrix sp.]|nr:S-layer protein domain-containing protein [Methanothrix sp.]
KTYYYKNPVVGEQKKLITVAVHFKNAFRGADSNLASIDGIWQISDAPTEVKADTQYGKMTIRSVDESNGVITMDNKDNSIILRRNKDTVLMADIKIKTADNDTLRFYPYKLITNPGDYQIRGAIAGTVNGVNNLDPTDNSFYWNPQTFAGFYYDLKEDLGTETLKMVLTDGNRLTGDKVGEAPYGITYTTTAQNKAFERDIWGSYMVIGFQGEKYFAGYNRGADEASDLFYKKSTDENSLSSEQLEKVLMDSKDEMTITSGTPLKLGEGYELAIKYIEVNNNYVRLELSKDGNVVDSKVISPSKDGATEIDKTYYYKNPVVGEQKKLITVAVHFKNAFRGADSNLASIDGIWQISDAPTEVKADTQYGKMIIRSVDGTNGVISMDNKDNTVTLNKNKDTEIMPGVSIKTADSYTFRSYIYKPVTIGVAPVDVKVVAPVKVVIAVAIEENKSPNILSFEEMENGFEDNSIDLTATAHDPENDPIKFRFILDNGLKASRWAKENYYSIILTDIHLGKHSARVEVTDNISKGIAFSNLSLNIYRPGPNYNALILVLLIWFLIFTILRNKEKLRNINKSKNIVYIITSIVCIILSILIQLSYLENNLRIILIIAIFASLPFLFRAHRIIENILAIIITWIIEHQIAAYAIPPFLTHVIFVSDLLYSGIINNIEKIGVFILSLFISIILSLMFERIYCAACKKIGFIWENKKIILIILLIFSTIIAVNIEKEIIRIHSEKPITVNSYNTNGEDARVTLDWDANADIDLYVRDPNGDIVRYNNTHVPSGGTLDRDNMCSNLTSGSPEIIYWPQGKAPKGAYKVYVNYYGNCGESEYYGGPVYWRVTTMVSGRDLNFSGTLNAVNETQEVTAFRIE